MYDLMNTVISFLRNGPRNLTPSSCLASQCLLTRFAPYCDAPSLQFFKCYRVCITGATADQKYVNLAQKPRVEMCACFLQNLSKQQNKAIQKALSKSMIQSQTNSTGLLKNLPFTFHIPWLATCAPNLAIAFCLCQTQAFPCLHFLDLRRCWRTRVTHDRRTVQWQMLFVQC